MIPKIKPEQFENELFTIKETKQDITTIMFVDFKYSSTTPISTSSASSYPMTIGPNIFQKNLKLDKLVINYKDFNINKLKEEINKQFYKKVIDLGKQHKEKAPAKRFDINVREIKKNMDVGRKIIATINSTSNYIAVEGRIGTAQWMVSNSKTYNYIFNYIGHLILMNTNNQFMIGNVHYMIDESIEDGILILGRKNQIDQPGVHCLIMTDDDGNILFNEINDTIQMYFKIDNVGFHTYTQYMVINTRDIQYYRNLKLQRIKEIHGT